ncbi:MAG: flagellin [Candidatus Thermoplasmatota archaeon]
MRWDVANRTLLLPLKHHTIGDVGIGAMIVFIAMILVAGIAASVLIQTSSKLENQAMFSGQATISETSTGISVESVAGYNKSGIIQLLAIDIRARAGSRPINLADVVLELSNSSVKGLLRYNKSVFTKNLDINGQMFTRSFYPINNGTTFGLIVIQDGDGSCTANNPAMSIGDHIILTINVSKLFNGIMPNTNIFGKVIPEEGSPGVISFTTPGAYTNSVIDLC